MELIFTEVTWILLTVTTTLATYCYLKLLARYQFWAKKGIDYLKPLPIVGNILPVICMKKSLGDIYQEAYLKYPNKKLVGVYEMFNPVLVIRDPKLVERVLVKDFQYFMDHPLIVESEGLFSQGLFQMKGSPWRSIRHKISPAFTSGKLKDMFNGMLDCSNDIITNIDENLNRDYEIREAIATYAFDVIANTVFGIQINDRKAREKFIKMGTSIFDTTPMRFVHLIALSQFPKVASWLGFKFIASETETFFKGLIDSTLKQRQNGNIQRNDYTQQLLKLKQRVVIETQSKDEEDEYLNLDSAAPSENIEVTDDLLAGQAFQFLAAGFDPIQAIMIYVMYDMCRFPEVQERARQHVKEVLDKHQHYSYACLKDMTYVEQCIQESLRLHALTAFLFRECTKPYYIPEEKLELSRGQKIIVPINALHMEPKYYPEPEVYKPERFPPNSTKSNFTYLPFGDGPRICIGARYALVVVKLGLVKILSNYKFTLSPKTRIPIEINKLSFVQIPKMKVYFNLCKI